MDKYHDETDLLESTYNTVDMLKLSSVFSWNVEGKWQLRTTLWTYRDFSDALFQSNSFIFCSKPFLPAFFLLWYEFDKF